MAYHVWVVMTAEHEGNDRAGNGATRDAAIRIVADTHAVMTEYTRHAPALTWFADGSALCAAEGCLVMTKQVGVEA